VATTRTEDGHK